MKSFAIKYRAVFVWVLTVALAAVFYQVQSNFFREQTHKVAVESYERCLDRINNVEEVNRFYQKMAALEATNSVISPKLRAERIKAYKNLVLASPNCGKKP